MGRILSDRVDGIFKNDNESREVNHNIIYSNINSTHR